MARVIFFLMKLHMKAQMEHRAAFVLDRVAQIIAYSSVYAALWILIWKFRTLAGWTWPELALLLGFQLLAYALGASVSFVQMRKLEDDIHRGTFDALMVKPFSPWAYLVFSEFNVGYAGHIVLAAALLAWSVGNVDIDWTLAGALYLGATLISASLLVAAILTMIGACAFILVKSRYLYPIFFGLFELTRYPIGILPVAIQWLLLVALPLGFVNYVPVAHLLGKETAIVGDFGGMIAPLVGPLFVLLAAIHWTYSVRRYQGAGG